MASLNQNGVSVTWQCPSVLQTIQFSIIFCLHHITLTFWLNHKTVLFQAIQFGISTQFSSIWSIDRTLSGATTPELEWTWERWQWRGTPHSPKLLHYWNLTIRSSSVISRRFLPLCRGAVGVFYTPTPSRLGKLSWYMSSCGLFFYMSPCDLYTSFYRYCNAWIPMVKKLSTHIYIYSLIYI